MRVYTGSNGDAAVGNSLLILDDLRNLEKCQEFFSQVRPNVST